MVVALQPDMVVVNADSERTVTDLQRSQDEGFLPETAIVINNEPDTQYYDAVLDGPAKTSDIVRRIRS
jgi:hypothetical protein